MRFFKALELEALTHAKDFVDSVAVSAGLIWTSQLLLTLRDGRTVEFSSSSRTKNEKKSHKTPKNDPWMSQYMVFLSALSSIPVSDAAFGFATRYRRRSPLPSAESAE